MRRRRMCLGSGSPRRGSLAAALLVLVGAGPAAAADPVLSAAPVDYVRICDAYGEGYLTVPGSATCLRIHGRVRSDTNVFFNLDDQDFDIEPQYGFGPNQNAYRFRARGYTYLDSRTETAFGALRTHIELQFTQNNANPLTSKLKEGYVQLGGLRVGRSTSYYDFSGVRFTETEFFDPQFSRNNPQLLIAYEAQLGALRAALSVEDNTGRRDGIASANGLTQYGGAVIPDVVVRLQTGTDDSPFRTQLMGATHYVNTVTEPSGHTSEALGFAVGAGVAGTLPFGRRSRVGLTGTYAHGALNFATTSASAPNGLASDAVFDPLTRSVDLSDYVSIAAGGRTLFTPELELALQAGLLLADPGGGKVDFDGDGIPDDLDFANIDLQTSLRWRPIPGFFVAVGAEYRHAATASFGHADFLTTYLRVQHSY